MVQRTDHKAELNRSDEALGENNRAKRQWFPLDAFNS